MLQLVSAGLNIQYCRTNFELDSLGFASFEKERSQDAEGKKSEHGSNWEISQFLYWSAKVDSHMQKTVSHWGLFIILILSFKDECVLFVFAW